jgi:hypothetical protein
MPKPESRIPVGFMFSQSSLQDYLDCPRRFELRYLMHVAWPAVESEPVVEQERDLRLGQDFHRMAQQYLLGVPAVRLARFITDSDLAQWWENFLVFAEQAGLKNRLCAYPEASLSAAVGRYRLMAQYDLIASGQDGRLNIFDWKTHRKRPRREWLASRMQSKVYPYIFVRAGRYLNDGRPVLPETVEMVYWFTGYPDQPEHFQYRPGQFEQDEADLVRLIDEIVRQAALSTGSAQPGRVAPEYPLTMHAERCVYCNYRSLCERGDHAEMYSENGEFDLYQPELDGINFEQIGEISF